jgi:hypothetical protein
MTSTTLLRRSRPLPTSQRRIGAIVGLLIGLAGVCHGCHGGDRDDELSLAGGKPRVERLDDAKDTAPTSPERERGVSP